MVGPQRPEFVLFGSSIVQLSFSNGGWGTILTDIYARKADILLRGYYGWNSRRALQVLDQVFPKDAAIQPSLVIVYFGGNDSMGPHPSGLGPHVPLHEYIENMRKIALHLKSLSETTRIIFLSCPPVNEARLRQGTSGIFSEIVRTNELCRSYSEACIDLCQEMGVKVVDLWTAIQKRDDWLIACFTDGVHLSAEGSKIVVEEILKVLKEAEWMPCLQWKSMPTEFAEDSPYYLAAAADGKTTLNPSEWTFHREIQWDLVAEESFSLVRSPHTGVALAHQKLKGKL
uniref:Putative GDSL esterase/lipase CPRD49 n=1 Tax=Davidia involucrata TaxID=16924 RepID=A0A5B7A109_DAVIN